MRTKSSLAVVVGILSLALAACGDDDDDPKLDKGPGAEAGIEAGVDMGVDGPVPDGPGVDQSTADQSTADQSTADQGPTADAGDTGVADAGPTTNTTCQTAKVVTLSGGKAKVTGSKTASDTDALPTCGSTTLAATDLWYKFTPTVGKTYKIAFTPQGGGRFGVWEDNSYNCSATSISTACGVLGSVFVSSGSTDSLYIKSTTGGDIFFVADGISSSYDTYTFTFEVTEYTPPSNTTCTKAQALTFSGTPATATVTGDTTLSSNEFGTTVDCFGSVDYDGPQLYYKVTLTAGKTYKIFLDPDFSSYLYVFRAISCAAAGTINTDCGSSGTNGDDMYVSSSSSGGSLFFTPTTGGDYVIAVDSSSATTSGSFTLTVSEFTPAANSTCAKAQTLTLSGSPASVSVTGDTSGTTDEHATVDCGKTSVLDGPQVYYQVNLQASTTYNVSLSPSFTAYAYVFRAASCTSGATAIDTDCSAGGGTGDVLGSVSSGKSGDLFFTPTTAGNYIIAVDSTASSYAGSFTLKVAEFKVPTFTAPLSWDFESSCQGLAATGDWECGQLNFSAGTNCDSGYVAPTAGASGSGKGMWGTKLNDCYSPLGNNTGSSSTSCSNTTPSDDSILTFKVTIPSSWTTATMTYYSWDDVNGYFDWMEIRVNNASVKAFCNPTPKPTAWVKNTVDLSSYAGQTITVAFHFLASTVVQYAGWYIDDLSISGS